MKTSIYVVESIQYKAFSYSFTAPQIEAGYYFTLVDAQRAMRELPPQIGRWVLISVIPAETPYPEQQKQALELYEWNHSAQDYVLHQELSLRTQRFVLRGFGLMTNPFSTKKEINEA